MLIQSEIGKLKRVLLHRPYHALTRLTPSNCKQFLFDDVLWPEKATEEHDHFSHLLSSQGVDVLYLDKLLGEALKNPKAKTDLIHRCLCQPYQGSHVQELISQYLEHLEIDELIVQLFCGITFNDLAPYSLGLVSTVSKLSDFIMPPLFNQFFMRDTSVWIDKGVCISRMASQARQAETAIIATIYRYHPLFQTGDFPIWYAGDDLTQNLPSIEGGDVLILNEECLLIGLSQRTQARAVEILANKLFQMNQITEILAVEIPRKRASMHLDTVLTMVNQDTFCSIYPDLDLNCWSIQASEKNGKLTVKKEAALPKALTRVLGLKNIHVISPSGDAFALEREQWNDAVNLLALRPGVVVAYEQNKITNQALRKQGIEVITFPRV